MLKASFLRRVTNPFRYSRATSAEDAARQLVTGGAVPVGGGTDLLVSIQEQIVGPDVVVDLRSIPESDAVLELPDGGLRIGASARIADLAREPLIRAGYPAFAQACAVVGTPALRNMGTLGGNLCQRPRCWYYRRDVRCLKNGGTSCPAVHGENQYLAILDGGPCYIVHPSDPAVALAALGAGVEISNLGGRRTIPIADFYVLPRERLEHETVLVAGEFLSAVILPAEARGGRQVYHKLMQRSAWDFALASVAACKRENGDVRIVLGGVAPRPWRVSSSVEEGVASGGLDDDAIAALAERTLHDARPLSRNGYKVTLAASLLRQALGELA